MSLGKGWSSWRYKPYSRGSYSNELRGGGGGRGELSIMVGCITHVNYSMVFNYNQQHQRKTVKLTNGHYSIATNFRGIYISNQSNACGFNFHDLNKHIIVTFMVTITSLNTCVVLIFPRLTIQLHMYQKNILHVMLR